MKVLKSNIVLQLERPTILNNWSGSTLRGALYSSFNHIGDEKSKAANEVLFNTGNKDNSLITNTIVIAGWDTDKISNKANFEITLFGEGIGYYDSILNILKNGVDLNGVRATLSSEQSAEVNVETKLSITGDTLTLLFQTPVHFKKSFLDLSFKNMLRAMLLREKAVKKTCGMDYDMDYDGLLDEADKIQKILVKVRKVDMVRNGTTGVMHVPCLVGFVKYKGDFSKFNEHLAFARYFNIGKWCSMGLGKIEFMEV